MTDMDEEAETEKWLRMVDKPLETKKRDKKDAGPKKNIQRGRKHG